MKRTILFGFCSCLFFSAAIAQRVGIGTASPHSSAQLDITSTDKGMLVPRIALTAANVASPVTSPADALLVYNTTTSGEGPNAVTPGFYYWNASTLRWQGLAGSSSASGDIGFGTWGGCSVDGISEFQPVVASDGAKGDYLGAIVDISGNFAIATAPFDTVGGNPQQGSAYIFSFNGTNWVQQQKLTAADGAADDLFGYAVAISGNYAIVGAPGDNVGVNNDQGSAYIFFYNGSTWVQQQKITGSESTANDFFGLSADLSGNYAIVGVPRDDVGVNSDQGSVYIYHLNGGVWTQQPRISANDGTAGDQFSWSVSLSGNYAVIGAIFDNSAYTYFYNGASWILNQKILPNDVDAGFFGSSVSIADNIIFVGAETTTIGTSNAQGAAYVYFNNGTNWVQQQKIFSNDGHDNDRFGKTVSVSGNYAIIGSPQADVELSIDEGVAYLYQNIGGAWIRKEKIINPNGTPADFSGNAAISNNRFIIGAGRFALQRGMILFGKAN